MIRIDTFGITADSHGYAVGKISIYKNKETKQETEILTQPRYHNSIQGCLKYIRKQMHYEAIKNVDGGIDEAVRVLNEADRRFESLISGVEKE